MAEKISNFLSVLTLFQAFSFVPQSLKEKKSAERKLCQALNPSHLMLCHPHLWSQQELKIVFGENLVRCVIFFTPLNTFFKFPRDFKPFHWLDIFLTSSNLLNCPLSFLAFSIPFLIWQHESLSFYSFETAKKTENSFIIRLVKRKIWFFYS